jgi:helicase SWR1
VVPTSVLLNWEMEFKKFLPGFKTLCYYGIQKERKERRTGWTSPYAFNVCITSYQIALADQHVFRRKKWVYMILDEAHNIKNFKSKRWETLLCFNSQHRLLLTGTPLQNNLMELWSLLYFLMPDEGDAQSFVRREDFKDLFQSKHTRVSLEARRLNVIH